MTEDDTADGTEKPEITTWDGGLSWIAHPDERGQRTSHALQTESGVWVIDPVDMDGLDDQLAALGDVAGVLVLLDRHTRDAEAVADRHNVDIHVPEWMTLARSKLESPAEPVGETLPGTKYTIHQLIATDEWEEAVLVDDAEQTLVVPEAVGTLPAFEGERQLGIHPGVDDPPMALLDWEPNRILVGHGQSIHSDADSELRTVLDDK
ncbi:hypothetical protein ACFQJ7_17195 [Halovenus rubra]|uniref:Uncharacterized protein n=2 Tax=Halovenus rubra TaxID=869890 RepID=A0ACC7DZH9_9EURY|nr:hypothetical protein [Halovenus rubra]